MKIIIKNNPFVKELTIEDFNEITKSDKPYVIKFYSSTCHLCKGLKPIFNEVAELYSDKFYFGVINSRTQRKLFELFKIDGVPEIFIIYRNKVKNVKYPSSVVADPVSGYPKDYIIQHLENYYENRKID
jgi:thioredoxin 1